MWQAIVNFFSSNEFLPHAYCLVERPGLIAAHVVSDSLIALAYFSIPLALLYFARQRKAEIPFSWMFVLFGVFILACGMTHVLGIWTLWFPNYHAEALVKFITAVASVLTAIALWRIMPLALSLPSPERYRQLNEELEMLVGARTAELEASNAKLRLTLEEKEILLNEVHHRVKNNLQVIVALMHLQAKSVEPKLQRYFAESMDRVHAMARVHEQLQSAADATIFDIEPFLKGLCAHFNTLYGSEDRIRCSVQAFRFSVPFDLASPLALVLNETIANAYKHAFPDGRSGDISVKMDRIDGLTIRISDNGVGRPKADTRRSLGTKMIEALTRQLGAKTTWRDREGGGTEVAIALPF